MNKKRTSISVCMMLALSISGIIGLANISGVKAQANTTLIYGTSDGPVHWDPIFAWDSASFDVLVQITEGLWMYDYSTQNATLGLGLAKSFSWSPNGRVLDVNLRTGVIFHDGTPFNAQAVKWNYDRMLWFFGFTSGLAAPFNTGTPPYMAQIQSLYVCPNGTQLFQPVQVLNDTAVRFTLNMAYTAFTSLLGFMGSYLLSPASTPAKTELNVTSSNYKPVGTGPFAFDSYVVGDHVLLKAFPQYWRGAAKLGGVYFDIINDAQTRNNAMLSKEIHILPDPLPAMISAGSFNITGMAYHPQQTLTIGYIGMNNELINVTIRKALSFAYDYDYHLVQILHNQDDRLHGVIPAGMQYYNGSINYTHHALSIARKTLVDAGLANGSMAEADWAWRAANRPIAHFNYTYNSGNAVRQQYGSLLVNCSKLIGIKIESLPAADWGAETTDMQVWDHQKFYPIYAMGWSPDFNDPDDYIRPLLVRGASDFAHVNDAYINTTVAYSLSATTVQARQSAYNNITDYVQNTLYPMIFTHQYRIHEVWLSNITGYQLNIMNQCYFYPITCAICTLPAAAVPGYDVMLIGFAMIAASIVSFLIVRKKLRM